MNPELQILVERLEWAERRQRTAVTLAVLALVIAIAAVAQPFLTAKRPGEQRARYSVVEANRFLLRDVNGETAGGLEVEPQGNIKLVLGRSAGGTAAAFLEVQPTGT